MNIRVLVITLCVLMTQNKPVLAQSWNLRDSLPADVRKAGEGRDPKALNDLTMRHLQNPGALSDDAVTGLIFILLEEFQKDVPEILQEHQSILLSRPAVALRVAGGLESENVTAGRMVDGHFVRGPVFYRSHDQGMSSARRNRWLALKLVLQVRSAFTKDTPVKLQAQSLSVLATTLSQFQYRSGVSPENFLSLTSLSVEPEIESYGSARYGWSPPTVGNDPQRWFFKVPQTFEDAQSDGERWRWALAQMEVLGGRHAADALFQRAMFMHGIFTTSNLSGLSGAAPIIGRNPVPDTPEMSLHTLDDDEFIVLAGGRLQRLLLPEEFAFLTALKKVALDTAADGLDRTRALDLVVNEWAARWQYDRIEAFLKTIPNGVANNPNGRWTRFSNVAAPGLRFERQPAQVAGKAAVLRVVSRNVAHAKFTAHAVDLRKVIADMEKRSQQPLDKNDRAAWKWSALEGLDVRLRDKNAAQWFSGKAITWVADLPHVDHLWDQQNDLPTPLVKAGLYLIECDSGMPAPAQTLLWLDDLVTVSIPQQQTVPDPSNSRYSSEILQSTRILVLDAITGKPVPDASLTFSGGRSLNSDKKTLPFASYVRTTDATGSVVLPETELSPSHEWILRLEDKAGRFHVIGPRERFGPRNESDDWGINRERVNLFVISNQPAYHPGDEARWKAWMRVRDFDPNANTNPYAGGDLNTELSAPQARNNMLARKMKFDAETSAHGSYTLPEEGVLGIHGVHLHGMYQTGNRRFPVEKFRKPEFLADATVSGKPVKLGGTFEFKIQARYYSGVPLLGGMVRYHITRQSPYWQQDVVKYPATEWDWLYRNGERWQTNRAWEYRDAWEKLDWSNDSRGEVLSGLAPLGADGTLIIPVDTKTASQMGGGQTQQYTLHAWVMDATQRQIELTAEHVIGQKTCTVVFEMDRGFYRAGQHANVKARFCTSAGVELRPEEVIIHHTQPDGTSNDMAHGDPIALNQTGVHQLLVKAKLADGQTVEHQQELMVIDADDSLTGAVPSQPLNIFLHQTEYASGEEAEFLITSQQADATVWLFPRVMGASGYPDPIMIQLKNHCALYRIPVKVEDYPNFIVQAITVLNGRTHSVTRQVLVPPKHVIARVRIEPEKANYQAGERCRIKITTSRFDGTPLQANVAFTAYDQSLEAIAQQSEEADRYDRQFAIPDIRSVFWGWRRTHVQRLSDSFHVGELSSYMSPGMSLRVPSRYTPWRYHEESDMAAMACSDSTNPNSIPPEGQNMRATSASLEALLKQAHSRTVLRDSISWEPNLHTDAKGEAFVEFTLPENFTTWTLRAWAVGLKTEVGQAEMLLPVTSPIEVRIAAPRFLIAGDETTVTATIHTALPAQAAMTQIEIKGDALELSSDASQTVTLDAQGSAMVSWKLKAVHEGSVAIRIKAACGKNSDATELVLPVRSAITPVTENWDLTLAPSQKTRTLDFNVPESSHPDRTQLEIRFTPSALSVIADALPYLAEYPHGCAEQTLNRFLPTLIAHRSMQELKLDLPALKLAADARAADALKHKLPANMQRWSHSEEHPAWMQSALFDADKVKDMVNVGLTRLAEMSVSRSSQEGGGWGWFSGSDQPNIPLTALIIHGFLQARLAGFDVNDNALQAGLSALEKHEDRMQRYAEYGDKSRPVNDVDAVVHAVLIESTIKPSGFKEGEWWREAKASPNLHARLIANADILSLRSRAQLALAFHQINDLKARDTLLAKLSKGIQRDASSHTAWIDIPQDGESNAEFIETQAAFLQLLVAVNPLDETAAEFARLLITHRSQGRFWQSTRDTAVCIEALAAFALATKETAREQNVEVILDGKLREKVSISLLSSLVSAPGILVDATDLKPGTHQLTLKCSEGGLASSVALQHCGKSIQAPSKVLQLRRTLWRIDPASLQAHEAGMGSAWRWNQRIKRQPLAASDVLKSGDIIEIECEFENKQPLEFVLLESPILGGLQPLHSASGWDWQEYQRSYREVQDDRQCFFMEKLSSGSHTLSIVAKVEHGGIFTLPPATISAMYSPSYSAASSATVIHAQEAR